MSYDNPIKTVYTMPSAAIGAGAVNMKFQGPAGKTGYVRDIRVEVTADMVGTTTVPEVAVGASAGSSEYARFRLGTAVGAGYTAANSPFNAGTVVQNAPGNTGGVPRALADFPAHVQLETTRIPKDTPFFISGVAGVGGAPAGTARYEVEIEWF
jgi:purine nucleoside phosphorylase